MFMSGTLGYSPIDANEIDRGDPYVTGAGEIAPGIIDYARQVQSFGESLFDTIARIRTQVQMTEQQRQLLDLQIERARTGQPPLNLAQYGIATTAQQQQLLFGMTPQTLLIIAVVVALVLAARKG